LITGVLEYKYYRILDCDDDFFIFLEQVQVQTECSEVQVYVQEITDRTVPCYYGLRPTRTVVRFVLLLHSIVS
jgi:hypothetical protein